MRLFHSLALLGIALVSALDDSYHDLGFESYNNGKWDAGFNARPDAIQAGGMSERMRPKIGSAEHGLNTEPIGNAHPGVDIGADHADGAKQRHHELPHPESLVHHLAQQGHAGAGVDAQGKHAGEQKHPAANGGHQNDNAHDVPAVAHYGKAQAKPAAEHYAAAKANGNHAKAAGAAAGQHNNAAGRGQLHPANGANAAKSQNAAAAGHAKAGQGAKAAQQVKQAQMAHLQLEANAQHRVVGGAGQQTSPMETPSPEPAASDVQHFVIRPPGDSCLATVYSTVTLAPGTTTM